MISLDTIESYYSAQEKPFSRAILREYLQYKILEIIFTSAIGRQLSFLGGTSLRILHGSQRFSEDLDFDNFGLKEDEFAGLAEEVQKGLELQGYKVEIRNVFKGAFHSYIRLPEILFDNRLAVMKEEKILIQIDTFAQGYEYKPSPIIINRFDVFSEVLSTPIAILLSQKIYAALNRKKAKGRDFFDIVFLLGKTKPDYGFLDLKLGIKNREELLRALTKVLEGFDFDALAADVEPFLLNRNDLKKVIMFREYINTSGVL